MVDLIGAGVVTGSRKHPTATRRHDVGRARPRLYEFLAENPGVEFWPVDQANDPSCSPGSRTSSSINATIEVDFLGQCASETLGATTGHPPAASPTSPAAPSSEGGQAFIVLHSTTADGGVADRPAPPPRRVVTTFKNTVDHVVTEYGVAELRGSSIAERTRRLIDVANPKFRDGLTAKARECGYLA